MKLWLTKNSEVPMRKQLVTQIKIGVASGDLQIGEKLPSRGEISRRFGIHENTVSNAYKELAEKNLIEFRQGSGFYVCEIQVESFATEKDLNLLTLEFIHYAQNLGHTDEEIQDSINNNLKKESPKEVLVIENDEKLREILIGEIKDKIDANAVGISLDEFREKAETFDSVLVALSDEEEKLQNVLPNDKTCIYLKAQSVTTAMQGETRPNEDSLIAITSGWDAFLLMAKTILVAAKVDGDSIILRSTDDLDWERGLDTAEMIICDSLTAKSLPNEERVRPFPLIANASIEELNKAIQVS